MMLMLGQDYVEEVKKNMAGKERVEAEDPVLLPDKAIWHPVAPDIVFETPQSYFEWYNKDFCPDAGIETDSPVVGIILQKSHINTKDDTHYVSLISEVSQTQPIISLNPQH